MMKQSQILLKDAGKGNIQKTMLSLKALQAKIDAMEASQKQVPQIASKVEGSRINRLYLRSSLLPMWLVTLFLGYATKIPFIKRIVKLLSLWYGKTTWWKILFYTRKVFILINAVIGVYMVFKSVGFSSDNLFAGFSAMGHTYYEIVLGMTKKLFNWFFDLFDHKVVPNVPNNPPASWVDKWPNLPPRINPDKDPFSLRELYMNPSIEVISSPWYKDLNNWLWIAGVTGGILLGYVAYKMCTDPLFIADLFPSNNASESTPTQPNPPELPLSDNSGSSNVGTSFVLLVKSVVNRLNPLNYFRSSSDIDSLHKNFMEQQFNYLTQDRRYYPFTEVKPFASWYDNFKISLFGESSSAKAVRIKELAFANTYIDNILNKGKFREVPSGIMTPVNLGIGVSKPYSYNTVWDVSQVVNVENNLKSIPSTPIHIPTLNLPNEWDGYFRPKTYAEVVSSSQVTLDHIKHDIDPLDNLPFQNADE
jgi:hypothetical protein